MTLFCKQTGLGSQILKNVINSHSHWGRKRHLQFLPKPFIWFCGIIYNNFFTINEKELKEAKKVMETAQHIATPLE